MKEAGPWTYPPEILETLARLGFAPGPASSPALVRTAVNDLYRVELRRLRDRARRGEVAKADHREAVVALRRKYWPLTLPLAAWERICRG